MTKLSSPKLLCAFAAIGLLAACAHKPPPGYSAQLEPRSGSQVSGTVTFIPLGDLTRVDARVRVSLRANMASISTRWETAARRTP